MCYLVQREMIDQHRHLERNATNRFDEGMIYRDVQLHCCREQGYRHAQVNYGDSAGSMRVAHVT